MASTACLRFRKWCNWRTESEAGKRWISGWSLIINLVNNILCDRGRWVELDLSGSIQKLGVNGSMEWSSRSCRVIACLRVDRYLEADEEWEERSFARRGTEGRGFITATTDYGRSGIGWGCRGSIWWWGLVLLQTEHDRISLVMSLHNVSQQKILFACHFVASTPSCPLCMSLRRECGLNREAQ